jgi:hypothetical protein
MRRFDTSLPIDDALPRLAAALAQRNAAVLVAPPGAGKTTRVPLVLVDEPWAKDKKILVLEPRRLAARAAASRMASTLGEEVGETVGLRVRLARKFPNARASRWLLKAYSRGWCSTIPRSTASPRCCSTNSTNARSMPISGLPSQEMCRMGCATI